MTRQYYAYQTNCSTNNQNFFIDGRFFSFPGLSSVHVIHLGALCIICADAMPKAKMIESGMFNSGGLTELRSAVHLKCMLISAAVVKQQKMR